MPDLVRQDERWEARVNTTRGLDFWIRSFPPPPDYVRNGWTISYPFRGALGNFPHVASHISQLTRGASPHPPHQHSEEEVIVVLSGEIAILTADTPDGVITESQRLGPGSFVYHGSRRWHTLRNTGADLASYFVFRWGTPSQTAHSPDPRSFIFDRRSLDSRWRVDPQGTLQIHPIEGVHPGGRLSSHLSVLEPGGGYAPHRDSHDMLIVLQSGAVETLDRRIVSPAVVFCAANVPHGLRNIGGTPAGYLVFEFPQFNGAQRHESKRNSGEEEYETMTVNPTTLRIEACSHCQLKCPLCPRARGETAAMVGSGYLKFENFKQLIDRNPQIRSVELANFGEVFLNKDLPKILEYAHARNVSTAIDEGANLNDASDQVLGALVKYQTTVVRCAIDGVTQATYSMYRAGGDLKTVLRNIQKINSYKERYQSDKPRLLFQFIIFGHNEHEMERAILLSKMLKMEITLKLNFYPGAMPVVNRERVRRRLGYADRHEYLAKEHKHYKRNQCYELWHSPQINWDGRLLGCSRNMWGVFADNVFQDNLTDAINNERMQYARKMLMGRVPAREDMPCVRCGVYKSMAQYDNWIAEPELAAVANS
ncbi:MAG: cupin domain-containing protein [Chloroflexi bacterium]|nr:cupin domain-containing protein [Chloroflexota bacterium]